MKRDAAAVLLLSAILLTGTALAINQERLLEEGQNISINGKGITLKTVDVDKVVVIVDWIEKEVYSSEYVSGVTIGLISTNVKTNKAWLNISINFSCGNNSCDSDEERMYCCKDCGCSAINQSNYECMDNLCVNPEWNKCKIDADCNDDNSCTVDSCAGVPRSCKHDYINECASNDDCCPAKCDYNSDIDCPLPVAPPECTGNEECRDNNPCTIDFCNSSCFHEERTGCGFSDVCFPELSVRTERVKNSTLGYYCLDRFWIEQGSNWKACKNDYECYSSICSEGYCTSMRALAKIRRNLTFGLISSFVILVFLMSWMIYTVAYIYRRFRIYESRHFPKIPELDNHKGHH